MHWYVKNKNLKKHIFLLAIAVATGSLIGWGIHSQSAFAQSINQIPVAVSLFNAENKIITNGEYEVRFALYRTDRTVSDAFPSNTDAANRIWEETQTITVKNGILRAFLGSVTAIPANVNFEGGDYYLGIRLGTDSEMVPRKKLGAVPAALNAQYLRGLTTGTAEGNILVLGRSGKVEIRQLPTGEGDNQLVLGSDSRFDNIDDIHQQNTDTGTDSNTFTIGSGSGVTSTNFDLAVSSAGTPPALRYNGTTQTWQFSNDGTTFSNISNGTIGSVTLGTDTTGNYVASIANGNGIEGADGGAEGSTLSLAVNILDSADGTGATSSRSGFEFAGASANELSLLQGCANGQGLAWDDTAEEWICNSFAAGLSGTGTPGYASYWSGPASLGSEQYLDELRGGTGLDGSAASNGSLLIGNGTGYTLNTLGAGNGVTITNGAGSVSVGLDVTTTGTTANSSSNSGLELTAGGLRMLGGCSNDQVLAWNSSLEVWVCSNKTGGTSDWTSAGSYTYLTDTADDLVVGASTTDSGFFFDVSASTLAFEGATANGFETTLAVTDPTADRTITFPNVSGTVITTGNLTDITAVGTVTSGTWQASVIDPLYGGTGATTLNNLIALTTHTTGNYVATITAGNGISGGSATEGGTPTLSIDLLDSADGTGATSSQSGLEFAGAGSNELSLLQGCADNQILSWNNSTNVWECDSVSGVGGLDGTGSANQVAYFTDSDTLASEAQLAVSRGGTGLGSYTTGDLLYASGSGTLAARAAVATGSVLISQGVGVAPVWGDVDLTNSVTGVLPVANGGTGASSLTDLITLTTHTVGNYVQRVQTSVLTGLTGGSAGSEGADLSLAFDYTATLAGNPALASGATVFSTTGLIFEGATANTSETLLTVADPSADRTITLPDATGTVITTGNLTDITATGTITSGTWQGTVIGAQYGGTGLNTSGSTGVPTISSGTWSVAAQLSPLRGGTGVDGSAAGNGTLLIGNGSGYTLATLTQGSGITVGNASGAITISSTLGTTIEGSEITNDTVVLSTDTAGNYVATITAGNGISGSSSTEGGTPTIAIDLLDSADGTGANSSFSGLEFAGGSNNELTLLQGCTDQQILAWVDATNSWDCTSVGGVGAGDITAVGDVLSGAAFTGTAGTQLVFNDADGDGTLTIADLSATRTWTLPNVTGTIVTTGDTGTVTGTMIADNTIEEVDLEATNAPTDGYILAYDNATGGFTWISNTGGTGSSKFTDSGSITYLTDTADNLAIGGTSSNASRFFFDVATGNQMIFEGTGSDDANETFLVIANPTGDRTVTIPDATGTIILSGHSFTGDVTATLDTDGSTALTIATDSVVLGTDTTGNYVSSATANGGLTMTGTEGASLGILLPSATDGLSTTVNSASGLELLASGLTLIQGCSDNQILSWDEANDYWECNSVGGVGAGDITAVGDVTSGAAFDGTAGTQLYFNDADGDGLLTIANLSAARTYTLPDVTGTLATINGGQTFTSATWQAGTIAVSYGGTGTTTFTSNGVLYGNGTGAIQATAAGANATFLVSVSGTPTFVSMSGDATITNAGVLSIAADAVTLGTDTTGNYVATITAGNGISGSSSTEGGTPTIAIDLLDSADGTGASSSQSGLEFAGAGSNELALLQGCTDNQILSWNDSTNVWECDSVSGVGGIDGTGSANAVAYWTDSNTLSFENQLSVSRGGTGLASYTTGDLLYASGATTLAGLNAVASGSVLLSNGTGVAPSWGQVTTTQVQNNSLDYIDFEDTMDLDGTLTLNQTTNTWTQTFTGTTTTGYSYTANSLTTGSAFSVTATNAATSNTALTGASFNFTNNQTTASNSNGITGLAVNFTQNPSASATANNEYALRVQNQVTSDADDTSVTALLLIDNADTTAAGTTVVTDAIRITNSGGSGYTNILNTDSIDITATGVITGATWQGNAVAAQYGGTGLNTSASTGVPTISSGTWSVSATLGVATGGTGASTLTPNGVLYGNGTGAIQATSAGTTGQLLVANGSGTPVFVTMGTDATINASGSLVIANNAVALGTDTTGNYVATITAGNGISGSSSTEGGTPTIAIDLLDSDDSTGSIASNSGLEFAGAGNNELTLLQGCNDLEVLAWDNTTNEWECASVSGVGGITGSGTNGYVTYWTGSSSLGAEATLSPVRGGTGVDGSAAGNGTLLIGNGTGYTLATLTQGSGITVGNASGAITITSTLGVSVDLASEVTGTLPVGNGGTGATTLTSNGVLYGNGTGAIQATAAGTTGQLLIANGSGVPTFVSMSSDATINASGVITIANNAVALTTDTTGNYVATITAGNGISGSSSTEGGTPTIALGALSANWDQTGAFDISLNNAASEIQILESAGATFFGTIDVGDLAANATYTFSGASGTVLTSANYSGTLDSIYVNVGESPAAGDITGSFSGGLSVGADAVALGTDTTGNYVQSVATSAVTGLTGGAAGSEGAVLTLAFDYTATLAGNPALASGATVFSTTGLIFEGSTADTNELLFTLTDPTADRTLTLPNLSGTIATIDGGQTFTSATWNGTAIASQYGGTGQNFASSTGVPTLSSGVWSVNAQLSPLRGGTGVDGSAAGNGTLLIGNGTGYTLATLTQGSGITVGNASGAITITSTLGVSVDLASEVTGTLPVGNGGTGATTLTSNGVLYGNGTGAIQATAAGTTGQLLIANGSGVPTFVSMSSDATINASGVITIANNAVALTTDTTGDYVQSVANGNGITGGTAGSEGAILTLGIDILDSDDSTGATASNSGLEFAGAGNNELTLLQGCADEQVLAWDNTANEWVCSDKTGGTSDWTDAGAFTYLTATGDDLAIGGSTATSARFYFDVQNGNRILFEGTGADDASETFLTVTNPTADRTVTIPDASGTIILSGHTFTDDVTGTLDTDGSTSLTIAADSVALTTDTTGNYVQRVQTSILTGLTGGSSGSEGADLTLALDYTQALSGNVGLAANAGVFGQSGFAFEGATADTIETFLVIADPTSSDKTITFPDASGTVLLSGGTLFTAAGSSGSSQTISQGDTLTIAQGTGITTSGGATDTITIAATLGTDIVGSEIVDGTIEEVDLEVTNAPTGGYVLTYDSGTGGFTWVDGGGLGNSKWTDSGTITYLTQTGDDVALGGSGATSSRFFFDITTGNQMIFEGTGADDANETTLVITNPTADRTLTLPNLSGTIATIDGGQTFTSAAWQGTAIASQYGGTGLNTSSSTGVPTISSGTWSVAAQLSPLRGGTGVDGSAAGNGTLLIGNGSGYTLATLTQGSGITVGNASGAITISSTLGTTIEGSEITDGTIEEVDLEATNAPTDAYILSYDNATGGFTWIANTGGTGASKWTDGGAITYLTSTTDDLAIGGSGSASSRFFFDVTTGNQVIFEGTGADDANETTLVITNPSADRTVTFADRSGTVILSGDTFSGDISATLENDGDTALSINANSVALGTDTTGNYVATIADAGNSNITVSGSGSETAAVTLDITPDALDFTEFEDTLDLDAALTLNQTTNTWSQTFTGTTTTGYSYTATSLTTGSALNLTATNTAATNTALSAAQFNFTNAQATNANTNGVTGLAVNYTNNPSVAGNSEYAVRIQNQVTANTTDNAISSALLIDNADTNASGSTIFTDAITVTASGSLATPYTNILNTPNFDISFAGAIDGPALDISAAGAITGATGITSSGTITFSGFTTNNGLLYTNGSGVLAQAAAGTSAQFLVANGTGVPTFVSMSGDATITNAGVLSIAADSVVLGTDTTGNYVASITAGNGLDGTVASEGATPTLDIDLLDSADGTGATSSRSGLEFAGAGSDELALIQGCSNGQGISWNDTTNVWECTSFSAGLSGTGTNGYATYWSGTSSLGSEQYLNVVRGGTGVDGSAAANGTLLIGNGTGYSLATITGTANEIAITNGAGSITIGVPDDGLDFTEFQDTLDLDAALVLNQSTNTWTQNFTGTTTTGFTYNASALTSGSAMNVTGSGATMTTGGELIDVVLGANTVGAGITITGTGVYTGTGAADGLINVVANSLTTGDGSKMSFTGLTSGTGLEIIGGTSMTTNGELLDLNMGAATAGNGLNVTTTGVYTGTGLAVLTANSMTTGQALAVSTTGLTSGSSVRITGGTSMTTNGELLDLNMGAATAGNGLNITTTGVYTGTGLAILTANSATTTTGVINISATGLTTGYAQNVTLGTALTTGGALNVTGASYATAAGGTGSLINLAFTEATAAASSNTIGNGIAISPTVNTSGAGTKDVNGVLVNAPTITGCATGACTINGFKVNTLTAGSASTITSNGFLVSATGIGAGALNGLNITGITGGAGTETAVAIGSGWDTYLDTASIDITGAGAITGATGITSSGTITFSGLSTAGIVTNTSGGVLGTVTSVPIANGGTNATTIGSAGSIAYSTGTAYAFSGVGTSGQAIVSGGTGAPTFFAPTAGSVVFAGTSGILQQDNASFFFDDTNNRLGLRTNTPDAALDIEIASATESALDVSNNVSTSVSALVSNISELLSFSVSESQISDMSLFARSISTAVTGAATVSGDVMEVSDSQVYFTGTNTISGQSLDLNRSVTNFNPASTTVSGAVMSISDATTVVGGTVTNTADTLQVSQAYTSASGATINVANAGTGLSFRVNDDGTFTDSTPFVVDASGNVGIGNDTTPVAMLTIGSGDAFQVNSSGAIAAATGITSSGTITFSGLSAGGVVQAASGTGVLSVGTIGASSITADSLDFTEFQDQLDLDASTDILADGSEVFSLTNTGTGNSFLVNDASGDTTPFVIDASGNVGIGLTAPNTPLEIRSTAATQFRTGYDANNYLTISTSNLGTTTIGTSASGVDTLVLASTSLSLGDASGDSVTVNSANWTFANDTNFALSGGVNGLSFDTTTLSIDALNNRVGIGTAAPTTLFELYGTGTADAIATITAPDATYDPIMKFRTGSTPAVQFTLGVDNSDSDKFKIFSGDGFGGDEFTIDSNGVTSIANLNLGATTFDENAGAVTWIDMSVTAAAPDNTVERYTAMLDGNAMLTIYGLSDGAGSVDNLGVGIMDTTPDGALDFDQTSTSTTAATTYGANFTVSDTGVVSSGTDTTFGQQIAVTRTGASGGTIVTTGLNITVTGDTGGTSTANGLVIAVSGADTNNGITSNGTITFSGLSAGGVVQAASGTGVLSVGTIGASSITADSLDFTEFQDQLDLDASTDILADGSEVFSLTNSGTGISFRVNDQSSDTTPFVVDAAGQVGIGTSTPSYPLDITGTQIGLGGGLITIDSVNTNVSAGLSNTTGAGNGVVNYGRSNTAAFDNSVVFGISNTINTGGAFNSMAIGHSNTITVSGAAAIGTGITNSTANSLMIGPSDTAKVTILSSGNVGIGTAAPTTLFELYGAGSADAIATLTSPDATYDPIMKFRTGSTPAVQFTLGVDNSDSDKFKIFSGDGLTGGDEFVIDSNGVTSISNLNLGATTFDENAGAVTWIDMSVTAAAAVDTVESYSAAIDGNDMLTVYAESDGAGSIQDKRIQIGVGGAGSTAPVLLALDVKSTTSDPAGFEGAMYYNTFDNKFRCYQTSAWTDCISSVAADSLDFAQFEDTMDLDANLVLNQTTNTWSQTFTGTTTTGLTYTANSLTSGKALSLESSATALTGQVANITLTGSNASNTGNLLRITDTGASNATTPLFVSAAGGSSQTVALFENTGTGASFRVNDAASDTTPFLIDASGQVGIGTTSPAAMLNILGTSNALRLSYDVSNYATLSTASDGTLSLTSSNVTESQMIIGNGGSVDASVAFDGASQDYYAGLDHTTGYYTIGSGFVAGSSTFLAIDASGNVGIGTGVTAPGARLDVSKTSTSSTAGTEYGIRNVFSDTGAVVSGVDTTYGTHTSVTRSGAGASGSPLVTSYGNYTDVTHSVVAGNGIAAAYGDYVNVAGSTNGTSLSYGYYASVSGADSNTGSYVSVIASGSGNSIGVQGALTDSSTTGNTNYGSLVTNSDTGVVTTGTDTSYGSYIGATRTGATGGTINTYGLNVLLSTDNAGSGTSTAYGAYIDTGVSGSANADTVYGLRIAAEANSSTTAYGLYVDSGTAAGTEYAAAFLNGNVGIGTAAPTTLFELYGTGTADAIATITAPDATYDPIMKFRTGSTPAVQFTLGVDNSDSDKFKIFSGDGLSGGDEFVIDSNGVTTIANLNVGASSFDADAGIISWIDMPVTASSPISTVMSYGAQIDGNSILTVYAESDGAGSIQNSRVGVGTSSPGYRFDVSGDVASSYVGNFFNDGNNANRYGIQIQAGADDGSGTTYYLNALDGDGGQVGYIANTAGTFALTDVSDERTKRDIDDTRFEDATTILNDLRVVDYHRKSLKDGPLITGFLAQEVLEVYPNAVTVGPNGLYGIMKDAFIPLLVKGFQEEDERLTLAEQKISDITLQTAANVTTLSEFQATVDEQLLVASTNLNALAEKDVLIEAKLAEHETYFARDLARLEALEAANVQITLDQNAVAANIAGIQSDMALVQEQIGTLTEFFNTFDLGNIIAKDELGNVDLLGGTLKARVVEAGGIVIENLIEDAPTIGQAQIYPKAVDEDGDGKDDATGDDMSEESVQARNGKVVEIYTKAMIPMVKGSRIFTTFLDNPNAFSWIEKIVTEEGEYVGFRIHVSEEVTKATKVDWWLVEQR